MVTVITFEMITQVLMVIMAGMGLTMMPTMSKHAEVAHAGQRTNAQTMVCAMTEYLNGNHRVCQSLDLHLCTHFRGVPSPHAKILCSNGGMIDGMVVGLRNGNPVVVTAFKARPGYWLKQIPRDRCIPLNMTVFEGYFRVMFPGLLR